MLVLLVIAFIAGQLLAACAAGAAHVKGLADVPALLAALGAFLPGARGVRLLNVEKNTGRASYCFNVLQRKMLPEPYRPPPSTIVALFGKKQQT